MVSSLAIIAATLACVYAHPTSPRLLGDENANWRVVGGSNATEGQFPYQVSLRKNNRHSCGATLISTRWIVTAAHCVDGVTNLSTTTFVVGTTKLNSGGSSYNVSKLIIHPGWDRNKAINDIALIRSAGLVTIGDKVHPTYISNWVGSKVNVTLSGWGRTSYPGTIPNVLQFVQLLTIANEACAKVLDKIHDTNICTLTKAGQGACHGDSGGPLVDKDRALVGIVSWGRPCAKGYPDVYTRASSYIKWIETNAQG